MPLQAVLLRMSRSQRTKKRGRTVRQEDSDLDTDADEDYVPDGDAGAAELAPPPARTATAGAAKEARAFDGKSRLSYLPPGLLVCIVPYLGQGAKLRFQEVCRTFSALISEPASWTTAYFTAAIIGRRTTSSGRVSRLSEVPLFEAVRQVVQQPRFSQLTAVSLEGLFLGPNAAKPAILEHLAASSPNITRLNLLRVGIGMQIQNLPQTKFSDKPLLERAVVEHWPRLKHLAIETVTNEGFKTLIRGLPELLSLHVLNVTAFNHAMHYPNDAGIASAFAPAAPKAGAPSTTTTTTTAESQLRPPPSLTALTLQGKAFVGAKALRAVLAACKKLESLEVLDCEKAHLTCIGSLGPLLNNLRHLAVGTTADRGPNRQLSSQVANFVSALQHHGTSLRSLWLGGAPPRASEPFRLALLEEALETATGVKFVGSTLLNRRSDGMTCEFWKAANGESRVLHAGAAGSGFGLEEAH